MSETKRRVVVGISGASGAAIGLHLLQVLSGLPDVETHLVISKAGRLTLQHELGQGAIERAESLATVVHSIGAIGSTIASGSFQTSGMIVAPCSIRTMGAIASCLSDNLLTRAADVHMKERRHLVLMVRESPLHLGHLRAMTALTEMGAIIAPPVLPLYQSPQTLDAMIDQMARRAIDLLRLTDVLAPEWRGL